MMSLMKLTVDMMIEGFIYIDVVTGGM